VPHKHFAALLTAIVLVLAAPMYAGTAHASGRGSFGNATTPAVTKARAALAKVDHAFAKKKLSKHGKVTHTGEATMALRDLMAAKSALTGAERRRAESYFLRPTSAGGDPGHAEQYTAPETVACGINICLHYVDLVAYPTNKDATSPAQAAKVLTIAEQVWAAEVTQGGYRAPLSDATSPNPGPDGRLDIYLAQEADNGLYGYCTSDDPNQGAPYRVSAYCVIDNDFVEFPNLPDNSLKVTLAHEFFHAVQFAYEWDEDFWFMEGTAAWIEDEVYDEINDNMIYLAPTWKANTLLNPGVPLDTFSSNWPNYGTWTFFKKLSERYPAKAGSLPAIIHEIWDVAADIDIYSTAAVAIVLKQHGNSFKKFFTDWGVGNRFPALSYEEGAANGYPTAPLANHGSFKLSKKHRNLGWKITKIHHMSNIYARFTPKKLKSKRTKLLVTFDEPDLKRGSAATLTIFKKNGKIAKVNVKLNKRGDATKKVAFSSKKIAYVELTLTNASIRFTDCWKAFTPYSCSGVSKDDKQKFRFNAKVIG